MPKLTKEQANFLYQLLDKVSISGVEQKAMVVDIMRALLKTQENDDRDDVEATGD